MRTKEEHTSALAAYLPNGKVFEAKNIEGSNLRAFLKGLSGELFTAQNYITTLKEEYFPDTTTLFIDEWEATAGIPDSCFKGDGTIEERRRDVLVKLAASGVQTDQDFIDLAALFGVEVTITAGRDEITFPLTFPVLMFNTVAEARFTTVVKFTAPDTSRFPLTFPILFGTNEIALLECIFKKLKPKNCNIIFQQR